MLLKRWLKSVDIRSEVPKILTEGAIVESDYVITMGCGDVCTLYPGKQYLDWKLEDPAGKDLEFVRKIRDDIKNEVISLLEKL